MTISMPPPPIERWPRTDRAPADAREVMNNVVQLPSDAPKDAVPPVKLSLVHPVKPPRIEFLDAGMERHPRSSWGPNTRTNYTVIVVSAGKGEYFLDGVHHEVTAGQCFMLPADAYTYYHTDWEDIWTIWSISFTGEDCESLMRRCGFSMIHPVVNVAEPADFAALVQLMLEHGERTYPNALTLQGLLYEFIALLLETGQPFEENIDRKDNDYIERAISYIQNHLHESLQVNEVAEALFISRSYLTTLFRTYLRITPKVFIMKAQMFEAAEKLRSTSMPIAQIAATTGYSTPFAFSKTFKRIMGMSPREFRTRFTNPDNIQEG